MDDSPWWNVLVTVGQERFGGLGLSLSEAVENLRKDIAREYPKREAARQAVLEELDRVRL